MPSKQSVTVTDIAVVEHILGQIVLSLLMFCCQILQKEELPQLSASHLDICNKTMNVQTNGDIGCIQLVYGLPGLYQGLYIYVPWWSAL